MFYYTVKYLEKLHIMPFFLNVVKSYNIDLNTVKAIICTFPHYEYISELICTQDSNIYTKIYRKKGKTLKEKLNHKRQLDDIMTMVLTKIFIERFKLIKSLNKDFNDFQDKKYQNSIKHTMRITLINHFNRKLQYKRYCKNLNHKLRIKTRGVPYIHPMDFRIFCSEYYVGKMWRYTEDDLNDYMKSEKCLTPVMSGGKVRWY